MQGVSKSDFTKKTIQNMVDARIREMASANPDMKLSELREQIGIIEENRRQILVLGVK